MTSQTREPSARPALGQERSSSAAGRAGTGPGDEGLRPSLAWVLRLRWGAIAGQLFTIFVVGQWMNTPLPHGVLFALIGVELLTNVACAAWLRSAPDVREWMLGALMALDVLLLTALLYVTGGVFNPFSFLYLVHIALAAVVLRDRWTWTLVGLSFTCLGLLFLGNVLEPGGWLEHPEQHAHHIEQHLQGMWVAFGIAAAFIVYFVTRVTRDLTRREAELALARQTVLRSERLASLATLAAGAAHELATPLSTIAVVAKELEQVLEHVRDQGMPAATVIADARLIRHEVQRCRAILAQMAEQSGEASGEGFTVVELSSIVQAALTGLTDDERARVVLRGADGACPLQVPAATLARVVRGIIKNALQSSSLTQSVELSFGQTADGGRELRVVDHGSGMADNVFERAGEPFFTTKEPGQGMGLGLFLARTVVEHLGGTLRLQSRAGHGTQVAIRIPCASPLAVEAAQREARE